MMPPFSARRSAFGKEEPIPPTILSRIGTGLFDTVDLPGNVVRSAIKFGQTGEFDYLTNIAKNISPFHVADRVSGESITGDPWSGFMLEVVGDPLFLVSGVGALTPAGKAFARINKLRASRRIAMMTDKVEDVATIDNKIGELKKVIDGARTSRVRFNMHPDSFQEGAGVRFSTDRKVAEDFTRRNVITGGGTIVDDIKNPRLAKSKRDVQEFSIPKDTKIFQGRSEDILDKDIFDDMLKEVPGFQESINLYEKLGGKGLNNSIIMKATETKFALGSLTKILKNRGYKGFARNMEKEISLFDTSILKPPGQGIQVFRGAQVLPVIGSAKKRSIVSLGLPFSKKEGIHIGDAGALSKGLAKLTPYKLLPSKETSLMRAELPRLEASLFDATRKNQVNRAQDLTEQIDSIKATLAGIKPNIVPQGVATQLGKMKNAGIKFFGHNIKNGLFEANERAVMVGREGELFHLEHVTLKSLESLRDVAEESIRKLGITEQTEIDRRILALLEGTKFKQTVPELEAQFIFKNTQARIDKRTAREIEAAGNDIVAQNKALEHQVESLAEAQTKLDNSGTTTVAELLKDKSRLKFKRQESRLDKRVIRELEEAGDDIIKQNQAIAKQEDRWQTSKLQHEIRTQKIDEFVAANGKATVEELQYVNFINKKILDPMVENAQNLRIDITPLKNDILSYFTRAITPEYRALKSGSPAQRAKYRVMMFKIGKELRFAKRRQFHLENTIPEINQLMKDQYGIKFNVFHEEPLKALMIRKRADIAATNSAAGVLRIVEIFAEETKTVGAISEAAFIKKMGLNPNAIGDLPAIEAGKWIPEHVVEMAQRKAVLFQKEILDTEKFNAVLSMMDKINQPFKVLLTVPFSSFHNRNMIGNIWLNMMGGVTNPKRYIEAANILHRRRLWAEGASGMKFTGEEIALFKELAENKITAGASYTDLFKDIRGQEIRSIAFGKGDPKAPLIGGVQSIFNKVTGKKTKALTADNPANKIISALVPGAGQRQLGQFYEDMSRVAHYLDKKAGGLLPAEATRSVNKYLFDYTNLTIDEQKIMRPTFLFYTWMRNNIPLQINSLITEPRIAAFYGKLTNLGTNEVPDYLRERSAIPSPFSKGHVLGTIGAPIEELNLSNVNSARPNNFDQFKRGLQKGAAQLNPILRVATELLTGEQAFSRRPLRTMTASEYILHNLPTSRFHRVASQIVDPEDDLSLSYIHATLGVREYKLDELRGKADSIKRRKRATGKFHEFPVLGARKRFKDDPEVKDLNKKAAALLKKITERNKRRRR